MPSRDQLELITPDGQIVFHDLDPQRGLTNIGCHPDNDLVLDGPGIADFHAVLDHRARPCLLILLVEDEAASLSGQIVPHNFPVPVNHADALGLDGYTLIFLEGASEEPLEPAPPLPQVEAPPVSQLGLALEETGEPAAPDSVQTFRRNVSTDALSLEVFSREISIDAGGAIARRITVSNVAGRPAAFTARVEIRSILQSVVVPPPQHYTGLEKSTDSLLDADWITVTPPEFTLGPEQAASLNLAIAPPRDPSVRAGPYFLSLVLASPDFPGWTNRIDLTLTVNPFYGFAVGELLPKTQTRDWQEQAAEAKFEIANKGNAEAAYQVSGEIEGGLGRLEFQAPGDPAIQPRQAEVRLGPEETKAVTARVVPLARHLIGLAPRGYYFTLTVVPLAGGLTPRSVLGQAHFRPRVGPLPLAIAGLIALALILLGFKPAIFEFTADPAQTSAGQTVVLRWSASPFSDLRIDPDVGPVAGPDGAQSVTAAEDVVYTLAAQNFLTWLVPAFRATRQARVLVEPVLPGIRFTIDRDHAAAGESVSLAWEVRDADDLILLINGVPETIPPAGHTGARSVVVDRDTEFVLQARNRYTSAEGITARLTVTVGLPSAAGGPLPVIDRFEVTPQEIDAGQSVTLEWSVSGVDKVTIEPFPGSFPAAGNLTDAPKTTLAYVLRASNGQASVSLVREVIVRTPAASTPPGEIITATPGQATATPTPTSVAAPSIAGLNPALAVAGGQGFTLVVSGSNFVSGATVQWNGSPRPTAFASATQLTATITAADLASAGAVTVTVLNPAPGGGPSNGAAFTVNNPAPAITGLVPNSAAAGGPGFTLEINGTGFNSQTIVRWNGSPRTVLTASATQLKVSIPAGDLTGAGSVIISVVNPAPGGGSDATIFLVNAPTATATATPTVTPTGTQTPTATPTATQTPTATVGP